MTLQIYESSEYVRIAKHPHRDAWDLEMKLDCYGGEWLPATSNEDPLRLIVAKVQIEIMLSECKERTRRECPLGMAMDYSGSTTGDYA